METQTELNEEQRRELNRKIANLEQEILKKGIPRMTQEKANWMAKKLLCLI